MQIQPLTQQLHGTWTLMATDTELEQQPMLVRNQPDMLRTALTVTTPTLP
jgi:hypothetical protein